MVSLLLLACIVQCQLFASRLLILLFLQVGIMGWAGDVEFLTKSLTLFLAQGRWSVWLDRDDGTASGGHDLNALNVVLCPSSFVWRRPFLNHYCGRVHTGATSPSPSPSRSPCSARVRGSAAVQVGAPLLLVLKEDGIHSAGQRFVVQASIRKLESWKRLVALIPVQCGRRRGWWQ